jgi:putative inorganic carbon (hco3(-)) transporter
MQRLWVAAAVVAANAAVVATIARGYEFEAFVVVVGAVTTLVVFQRPQRGLLILAAAMPFDGLRIAFGLPAVAADWIEAMLVLCLVAAIVARPGMARPETDRAMPGWVPAVAGLALLGVLSVRMVAPFQVVVGLKVAFQAVSLAYVAWRCPLNKRERDLLVTILMVTGAITALWGLVQQALGPAVLRDMGYRYNSTIRFSGSFMRSFSTFIQPFPFAFFLMIVVLLCTPIALSDTSRLRNRVFLALLPLYALGMLVAVVRGAWIGTAVGLLWLGIRRHRILLLGIPVALIILLIGPGTGGSNATSSASGQSRVNTWSTNLYEIGDHPFGVGIGSTGAAAQRINTLEGGTRAYQFEGVDSEGGAFQPDNQYFLYSMELGLAGLWCFLLLLVAGFRTALRSSERTGGDDSAFALGTAAVVLAFGVAGVVATILEIEPSMYYFWLLLGVASALAPDRKRGRVPAVSMRPLPGRAAQDRETGLEAQPV